MRRSFGLRGQTPLPSVRTLLGRWRRYSGPPLTLTCYGKTPCPLCDEARDVVDRIITSSGGRIRAEWVDINTDPALIRQWGVRIPVICLGERVLAEGHVRETPLIRAFTAAHAEVTPPDA